jgi:hypothetical protein
MRVSNDFVDMHEVDMYWLLCFWNMNMMNEVIYG